ncbi:sensor domain-containing diguanylate cyclase, partial [bacterium]|nr:sensor domain-containing diguanylate cyclase [bacterium]
MKELNRIWNIHFGEDVKLEQKIYYGCSAMVVFNFIILYIFNIIVGLNNIAAIASAIGIIVIIMVTVVGYISINYKKWAFINVLTLNLFLLPTAFFSYGGIASGMLSYLIFGIYISAIVLRGKPRFVAVTISFAADIIILSLNYIHPEFIIAKAPFHHFATVLFCITIVGGFIFISSVVIIDQFMRQRNKYETLLINLKKLSNEEPLTKLYNRRYLIGKAETELERRDNVCAVMIDIDNFKEYNDRHGHQFGDDILMKIAALIADIFGYENVCRYGGEEFLAIVSGIGISSVGQMAENLRSRLKEMEYGRINSE